MRQEIDKKTAEDLLRLARESIKTYFLGTGPKGIDDKTLHERRGVFVTLHEHGELRGCIGFPHPIHTLHTAIIEASRGAAFGDPRFPPLLEQELDDIKIEISILTVPKLLDTTPGNYPGRITIGKDGLIIKGESNGLLLPQVATEHHFTAETFLDCLAQKADLPKKAWKDPQNQIYTFQAEVIRE